MSLLDGLPNLAQRISFNIFQELFWLGTPQPKKGLNLLNTMQGHSWTIPDDQRMLQAFQSKPDMGLYALHTVAAFNLIPGSNRNGGQVYLFVYSTVTLFLNSHPRPRNHFMHYYQICTTAQYRHWLHFRFCESNVCKHQWLYFLYFTVKISPTLTECVKRVVSLFYNSGSPSPSFIFSHTKFCSVDFVCWLQTLISDLLWGSSGTSIH